MKRLFTLFAGLLLVGSGAFAQERWTNLVKNSSCEAAEDGEFSSFWCHEWRDPSAQFDGFANIVEDPADPKNHCVKVVVRSEAEADEAGNKIIQDGNFADYDSQFLIYLTDSVPLGKEIRLRMKVKGEVVDGDLSKQQFATQAHQKPGEYNHWSLFGNVPSKGIEKGMDGWTIIETDPVSVSNDHVKGSGHEYFQSVAFNLSKGPHAVVYFDDIRVEIRDKQTVNPTGELINFLRKGTLSDDEMTLPDGAGTPTLYTNFTCHEGAIAPKGERNWDQKARVIDDPIDGKPVLTAQSVGYNAEDKTPQQVEATDADGNAILDADGNPVMKDSIVVTPVYIRENGDTLKNNNGGVSLDDWATQFFVSTPHVFKEGEKMKLHFWYRSDKPASVDVQIHAGPGNYIYYQFISPLSFTEEWQEFNDEVTIDGNSKNGTTLAFNINKEKDFINYYFRFDELSAYSGAVKDEERVLKRESINLPVPVGDEEANVEIDMTPMVETLAVEDLVAFLNDNTMKVKVVTKEGEGENQEITESLSGGLQATTGIFINSDGSWVDEENGLSITFPEDAIQGNKATINLINFGLPFEAGNTIPTKIRFDNHGWYYGYDITLMDPEAYKQASGVYELKVDKKVAGVIYDLMGRKVSKMHKGLYIKDGKKYIVK